MFGTETLARQVSRKIRERGQEYCASNSVRILFADPEFVSAEVVGSQLYEVDLERDQDRLIYSCDCRYYEDNSSVCKHVWALLLQLEKEGRLTTWKPPFPTKLLAASEDVDQDDPELDDIDFEEESPPLAPRQRAAGKPATRSAYSDWSHLLGKMPQATIAEKKPPSWPEGREVLYVLETIRRSNGSGLAVEIDYRDPKKTGGWKKPRPLPLSYEMIRELPDPLDRDVISRFMGMKRETWYYQSYDSVHRFQLTEDDIGEFLPKLSHAGRLYLNNSEMDEICRVSWDEAEPWEFRIDVSTAAESSRYEVRGAFHRNGTRLDLAHPDHVFPEGILAKDGLLSPYRGGFEWVNFFRTNESFFVPFAESDQWLQTMLRMPQLPPLRLPEELQMHQLQGTPHPTVWVRTRQESWGAPYLVGTLGFDYLGHLVDEHDASPAIARVAERTLILRDLEAEKKAGRRLEEAGFKRQRDFHGKDIWKISQASLPKAVRDLVAEGWKVEAEGKLFRRADSFKLHIASGIDWFELHGDVEFQGATVAIPRLLSAMKRHENTILLDDGSFGIVPEEWLQKYGMLAGLGATEGDHVRFGRNQAGLLDALLASQPEVSCDELFDRVRKELAGFSGVPAAEPPPGFQGELRPYQKDGLGWMHFLERFGFGGCLADDMGLGKTVQVLAMIEQRRELRAAAGGDRPAPSLVVMPRSLVFNWRKEAERFTPQLRILEHTGGERIRGHEHFDDYDVIFTTYGTLRRDAPFFKEKVFDYIILDEAQAIKNASTESAKAARLLRGRHHLALSGTPIENHIGELWSLFEFLNPGMLGSTSVFKMGKGAVGRLEDQNRPLLAQALRPFILRRTKGQVARDLPEKVEQILFCNLEPAQRALYDELRDHYRQSLIDRIEQDGLQKSKIHILEALLRLRQAAIHPGLVDSSREAEPSAKLDMLLPQLAEVLEEGHKALIFSQFTSMLGILRRRLDAENITYEYLDGQTRDRSLPVERFQQDPDCKLFLISLKAGGLGLNLTAAEYVFLLDPWWNPAVEAQAIDRTHRIGQTRSVFAYRLIAKDTVEEKVLELQKTKREIADAIISQDNSLLRDLRAEDLEILLS